MTSKERVLMALKHEKPDRAPFNFWMDRRLMAQYEGKIGGRHWRVTHYGADIIESFINLPFPAGKFVEHGGTQWLEEPYPLDWKRVDDVPMPDPHADDLFKFMAPDLEEFPDTAVVMNLATPWGFIANMVGYENIYMAVMDYPEQYARLAQRMNDAMKIAVERAIDKGVTALYIQEDVASAKGMSMSHEMVEQFSFKYARQLVEIAAERGVPTLFHCCGKIMELMDDFIGLGVVAINPLQPHLNDLKDFKTRFGDKLTLYGGLDNCFIISQGTPEQVREHVFDVFETVGKPDGGLIFSTHDIDINCPPENIEAMVDAIKECRY
jgi:uroporphyrinogen decarboxylase